MNQAYLKTIKADHLNAEQKKAVLSTNGRILILAGAGSGKTSTLAYRMAHLIANCHVEPTAILGLTFTNKAAQEMRERIGKILPKEKSKPITLCTFHSFCMQVLREHIDKLGFTKKFSLYDEKDMQRLTTQLTRTLLEHEGKMPSLETIITLLKNVQQKGGDLDQISYESEWQKKFIASLAQDVSMSLRAYNAVDFDSLISLTVRLFQERPDVLHLYQERFRYIMIDEYQDTNPQQYSLAHLLSMKYNNLCVVGDDDQSIYGWRGAEVKHILEFKYDILIKLEQNYRSTTQILTAANSVIKNNEQRHTKTLWTDKSSCHPLLVFHAPSEETEAEAVVKRIIQLRNEKNYAWKDFAILYRSNQLSRAFESALMQASWKDSDSWKRGIPYEVFGGVELYERSEVKDLMAYLRVVSNPQDQEALLRIINYPRRGIAEKTLDLLTSTNRKLKIPLWQLLCDLAKDANYCQEVIANLPAKAFQNIREFVELITATQKKMTEGPMCEALSWLIEEIGYKNAISDEVKSDKMQAFKWENVEECVHLLKAYEESPDTEGTLHDFLSTTLLNEKKLPVHTQASGDHVNLLTFHSSKGLEFPVCFLVGLEDHLIPHEKSLLETGIEEERRLMYVALTRCKERLYLSMARSRKKHGKDISSSPSRFLFEIPKELMTLTEWNQYLETDLPD